MEWYSVEDEAAQERLLEAWRDAPLTNLEVCDLLLSVAQEQVIAYAPDPGTAEAAVTGLLEQLGLEHHLADVLIVLDLEALTDPPKRYVYAQLQQAKNLFNAGRAQEDGGVGPEGFSFIPRPLDKTIRAIIRPIDGKPHVL